MYRFLACLLVACNLIAGLPVLAAPAGLDTCAECHGADGMGHGNPMISVIAGIPAGHIEEAIFAYVDGARQCVRVPRMCEKVAALSEDEVTEFAVGFPLHGQHAEYLRYAIDAYFGGDREALLEVMANEIRGLKSGDLGALVNYYSSYRAKE